MLENQPFQTGAVQFVRIVHRSFGTEGAENPAIEEIEFVVGHQRAFRALREDRQPGRQEHVLEDGEVSVHGAPFHVAVAGDGAGRKHASVREGSRFQKSGEPAQVPHDSFRSDFFLDIEVQIGPEHVLRARPGPRAGPCPPSA